MTFFIILICDKKGITKEKVCFSNQSNSLKFQTLHHAVDKDLAGINRAKRNLALYFQHRFCGINDLITSEKRRQTSCEMCATKDLISISILFLAGIL